MRPRVTKNGPPESRKRATKQPPRHHFPCIRREPDKSEAIFLPMTWPQPQPLQPSGDLLHGALRYCLPFLPVTCCLRQDCRPNRYHAIICSRRQQHVTSLLPAKPVPYCGPVLGSVSRPVNRVFCPWFVSYCSLVLAFGSMVGKVGRVGRSGRSTGGFKKPSLVKSPRKP